MEHYRSRKIIYKFISDKIICVLDEKQHLVLNSANIIISNRYPMEILEKELDELMDKLANVEDFRAEIDRIQ